jgi:hypothetical protein
LKYKVLFYIGASGVTMHLYAVSWRPVPICRIKLDTFYQSIAARGGIGLQVVHTHSHLTSSLAPRRQRGSLFRKQQAQELWEGTYFPTSNHPMAEESQPAKRHKQNNSSTDTPLDESEPIGAQVPTQLANPIGEEAKVDAAPSNEAFLDSDARKTINDNLVFITQNLPKSRSFYINGLTSDGNS